MPTDGKTQTQGFLDQLSTEQLLDLVGADSEFSEDEDDDLTLRILEVIEEREKANPTGLLPDVDKAWADFQTYFNTPDGTDRPLYPTGDSNTETAGTRGGRRHRRLLKRLLPLAAVVAVTFSGMAAVQALGVDVFGALARWTDETFRFIAGPEAAGRGMEDEHSEALRRSFQDALDSCGITDIPAPSWYPEGTELVTDIDIVETQDVTIVTCEFTYNCNAFLIIIRKYNMDGRVPKQIFEKDASNVAQYSSSGRLFYIVSNLGKVNVVSSDTRAIIAINGTLSLEDTKHIIDSIGG